MGRQHQQHAAETDGDGRPAIDADAFLQHDGGENHHQERPGIAKRDRIGRRREGEAGKAHEHAGRTHHAALQMAPKIPGLQCGWKLRAPGQPQDQRISAKKARQEADLAGGIARGHGLDAGGHEGEGKLPKHLPLLQKQHKRLARKQEAGEWGETSEIATNATIILKF